MKLSDVLKGLNYRLVQGDPGIEVSGLSYDSRRVKDGQIFICITGFKVDGHNFISDAVRNGAKAVIINKEIELPHGVTGILVDDTRDALAIMSGNFYEHPSNKLDLIGVVGTNGKTTTTYLVRGILIAAGYKVGLMGTITNLIGDMEVPTERTTPESLDLQEFLNRMVGEGARYAVMEVSSHAIDLKRTSASNFRGGIFTNITQDHLDFHKTFHRYLATKTKFFEDLEDTKVAAINVDDPNSSYIIERTNAHVITYGLENDAHVRAKDINVTYSGTSFVMETPWGSDKINLKLVGPFNVYNSLGAASLCLGMGIGLDKVKEGLEGVMNVAGRFDSVNCGQEFAVIVDYAHTPDGLKNVLSTARSFARGRVICVFGCGGDRDKTKRPIMGAISGELSDYTIITSDNPRTEEPLEIMEQIRAGLEETNGEYHMVEDRRTAIRDAIMMAKPNDVVLIAGKGHENYQIFKDRTIHFDDREVAEEILRESRERE